MMPDMNRLVPLAALLLLVTGCSSTAHKTASAPTTRGAATTHTATPTPSAATVTQWASFIAAHQTLVLKADASMGGCQYAVDPRPCLLPGLGFTFATEALSQQIKNAESGQLGQPPAEIEQLVQSTIEALDAMQPATDAQGKCGAKADMACLQVDAAWDNAHDAVIEALNGWKPYTAG